MHASIASSGTVFLGLPCNSRCIFCAQEGLAAGESDAMAALSSVRKSHDTVTFVGGEPTLDPRLVDLVAAARTMGFGTIGIQTNARRLSDEGQLAALVRGGLTNVQISIHGAEPAIHDYHTGVAGSFRETSAGLTAARSQGLAVLVTTVVTRSNFRSLAALPPFLAARGVAGWVLAVPHAAGRAEMAFDRVQPRLGLALPFALHALSLADKLAVPCWIQGAPACLLGPFASRLLFELPRAYGPVCVSCEAREACPGVDPSYLDRFGGDELAARPRFEHAEKQAPIAKMFAGVGAQAPRGTPSRKVELPIVGKVKPGRNEVRGRPSPRSGEALKEILPDLFDGPRE